MFKYFFKKGVASLAVLALILSPLTGVPLRVETAKANGVHFASGEGTEESPFRIETCEHLQNIDMETEGDFPYLDAYFELDDDVDCTATEEWAMGNGFNPIGGIANPFTGNFDGRGKTITGLTVNRGEDDNVGLFANSAGILTNFSLTDVNITGAEDVGGVAGSNYGTISYVSVTGSLQSPGFGDVGGIAGSHFGTIENSFARVSIDSTRDGTPFNLGLIAGTIRAGATINKVYSVGFIDSLNDPVWNAQFVYGPIGSVIDSSDVYTIAASLFDSDVYATGNRTLGRTDLAEAATTAEMKDIETFTTDLAEAAWDFDTVWNIDADVNDGYPFLDLREVEPEGPVAYEFAEGSGTLEDPYEIASCEDLQGMDHPDYMGLAFELVDDIDCSMTNPDDGDWDENGPWGDYEGFNPIGSYVDMDSEFDPESIFYGYFNGNGYDILDLFIARYGQTGVGLFATISGSFSDEPSYIDRFDGSFEELYPDLNGSVYATIYNFNLVNPIIIGQQMVGALAGSTFYRTESVEEVNYTRQPVVKFVNVENGLVRAFTGYVAGLIARDRGGDISRTSFEGDIFVNYSDESNYNDGVLVGGLMGQGYQGNSRFNSFTRAEFYIDSGLPENKVWVAGLTPFMRNSTYADVYSASSVFVGEGYDASKIYRNDPVEISSYGALQNGRNAYFDSTLWALEPSNVDGNDNSSQARTTVQLKQQATYEGWNFNCVWKIAEDSNDGYPELITLDEWIENGCKANAQEPNQGGGGGSPEPSSSGGGSSGSRSVVKSTDSPSSSESSSEYAQEVAEVKERKIVEKELDVYANKCEALMMMSRTFGWEVPEVASSRYTDVPEWCQAVAAFGTERGIVEGREVDKLGMETPLTRNEVVVMITRELKLRNYEFKGLVVLNFSDEVILWAKDAVYLLGKEGIVKGFADGTFGGDKYILKQDLGVMLLRLMKKNNYAEVSDDSAKV